MLFKKKNNSGGKGADTFSKFDKVFDILNYTPVGYIDSERYAKFMTDAEDNFRNRLQNVLIDDLNDDMFDALIDSEVKREISLKKQEFTNHVQTISHHYGVVKGNFIEAQEHRANLVEDLNSLNGDIGALQQLKRETNRY